MISVGFWNLGPKNNLIQLCGNLVLDEQLDILVLAEFQNTSLLLSNLNGLNFGKWHLVSGSSSKAVVVTRLPAKYISRKLTSQRYEFFEVKAVLGVQSFILGAVHLPSRVNGDVNTVASEARYLSRDLIGLEAATQNRSIVIGDFNLQPFEPGMVSVDGLAGMLTRKIASRAHRTLNGRTYPLRYNPMWKFLGAETQVPGTCHYHLSTVENTYWNSYDQVVISQKMLDSVPDSHVVVKQTIGATSLLTRSGVPHRKMFSDHLPICCKILS